MAKPNLRLIEGGMPPEPHNEHGRIDLMSRPQVWPMSIETFYEDPNKATEDMERQAAVAMGGQALEAPSEIIDQNRGEA